MDGVAQIVVVLTIIEMSFLVVGLFDNLMAPSFLIIFMILSPLAALFALIPP